MTDNNPKPDADSGQVARLERCFDGDFAIAPEVPAATIAQHFGERRAAFGGGAVPPIYQNSTFVFPDCDAFDKRKLSTSRQYEYTRVSNPTTDVLLRKLAALEHGAWGRAFGSGMGAVSAALYACLSSGDHVVCVNRCYWPTRQLLLHLGRFDIRTTFVRGVERADFEAALTPQTKVLYLESPTSGLADVPHVAQLAELARARGIRVLFDNSWATPIHFRPLDHGCDLIIHSATKFIGGHSDVVAGVVIGREKALEEEIHRELELTGAVLDPFGAWLLLRGLRTLPLRMRHHREAALQVAEFLAAHPAVARVFHPGLASHPHHETAAALFDGTGSLFAFALHAQSKEACYRVMDALQLFHIGVSWGGHESLVVGGALFSDEHDAFQWTIRLHVGLEDPQDLIDDLKQALAKLS